MTEKPVLSIRCTIEVIFRVFDVSAGPCVTRRVKQCLRSVTRVYMLCLQGGFHAGVDEGCWEPIQRVVRGANSNSSERQAPLAVVFARCCHHFIPWFGLICHHCTLAVVITALIVSVLVVDIGALLV